MSERRPFNQILDLVKKRMAEIAESGRMVEKDTPELRKQVVAAFDEIRKLWEQGKPVQRRAQTVLAPIIWQAQMGIPPDKLDIGTATEITDLMQPGFTPQWSQFINVAAHALLGSAAMHGRLSPTQFLAAIQIPFAALYIYMAARRFGAPSVFELRDGLAEKLLLTDAHHIKPDDVRLPLPGFYIAMPPGSLEMMNRDTGWHKVSLVGVAEGRAFDGPREGRVLFSVFWSEPNARSRSASDDNVQVSFVSLPENYDGSAEDYESTIRDTDDIPIADRIPFVRWQGKQYSFEDGFKLIRKLVVNFCLYLSSPNPDIEPTGGKQTWKEVVAKADAGGSHRPGTKRQVTIGKNFALWDVGRKVARVSREMTATDILVRGFWRRQAHGPGRTLRQVIWIEPFVRRPTPGGEAQQEYAVEDRDIEKNGLDARELAQALAEAMAPMLGRALAAEVAANAAGAYAGTYEGEESLVEVVRAILAQRVRHAETYGATHLTDELIEEALAAVGEMEP